MSTANTTAPITLADFIVEAAMYPHSKEHYQLIKECSEIELMSMCLDNTDFVTESADLAAEVIDGLAILTESADAEVNAFTEKVSDKIKGFFAMIGRGWNKVIGAIVAMYGNVVKFFTKRNDTKGKQPSTRLDPSALLAAVKEMDDAKKAATYQDLVNLLEKIDPAQKAKMSGSRGLFSNVSKNDVRASSEIVRLLSASASKENAKKEFPADLKMLFSVILVAGHDGVNVRIPKFADKVFDMAPKLSAAIVDMAEEFNSHTDDGLRSLTAKIKSLSKELRTLNVGGKAPTADTISTVAVMLTEAQARAKYTALCEARDKIAKSGPSGGLNLSQNDASGAAEKQAVAIAELNRVLSDFQSDFTVYTGVAIKVTADALALLGYLDNLNGRIKNCFGLSAV